MLQLTDIEYTLPDDTCLLKDVTLKIRPRHFMAVVGPSGCGKTTLIKVIAGLYYESAGTIHWKGRDLAEEGDIQPQELGYVPQFSIAWDRLTVEECVDSTVKLRTRTRGKAAHACADRVINEVGMEALRDRQVSVLSGGQRRRLGLAMELVSHPSLLLCDEVTSGLDPQSERDIVQLLHQLSLGEDRTVINVTHSLDNLDLYDSVLVLNGGLVAYHGPPDAMLHYFSVKDAAEIYPQLASRPAGDWHESWLKYRDAYSDKLDVRLDGRSGAPASEPVEKLPETSELTEHQQETGEKPTAAAIDSRDFQPAGFMRQFFTLLLRRWRLFMLDRTQMLLHAALIIGFPILIVIFASKGIEPMPDRSFPSDMAEAEKVVRSTEIGVKQSRIGGLISGLAMFQVILLTLMGSNNSAREIAGERLIYEKERLGGLKPLAYLCSKAAFLATLIVLQAVWMALFVNFFAQLPGPLMPRMMHLLLVNAGMTFVCLAISSLMRSPEQASLLSIYLVGFQLPLSGAVIALPAALEKIVQPFIAAYWGWSGQLCSMRESYYFLGIQQAVPTAIVQETGNSMAILAAHIIVGLAVAWIGLKRRLWS